MTSPSAPASPGATINPSTPSRIASGTFDPRGDDRHTGGHRFQHNHRQAFAKQAGKHHQIEPAKFRRNVASEAGPIDHIGQVQSFDLLANLRFVLGGFESSDGPQSDRQTGRSGSRQGIEQHFQSFAWAEQCNDPNVHTPGRGRPSNGPRSERHWEPLTSPAPIPFCSA